MAFKTVKANMVADHAKRARDEGHSVLAVRLNVPATEPGFSGPISGWAEMIEAVEGYGWHLSNWSTVQDKNNRPEAHALFRRNGR